ncbi:AraC family transcriptional regulator [Vibrio kasasachensis]|uniref:helix-turn-helix domain-containing protein n=1 Tax=Vibrio kasasachensis TaxID=2910248 RepID=UPI003D115B1F
MKGKLERVPQRIGASWRYKKILEPCKSYGWHRHNEYEIAIHRNFTGHYFVGHYNSELYHNHMILMGPGLPHAIYSDSTDHSNIKETHVIWFRKQWINSLINDCHELKPLSALLEDAGSGLEFSTETAEQVVSLLSNVLELTPAKQLATLMTIFALLLEDNHTVRLINSTAMITSLGQSRANENIEKTEAYLLAHFNEKISLSHLAKHLFLSESSVRRLFSKHFNESFSQHLKKIRLNMACDMLVNTDLPVSIIFEKVGYENQANFNRQFKAYKRVTPNGYRSEMKRFR